MFTGIVEEKGTITQMDYVSDQAVRLTIGVENVTTDLQVGDSIAINGICLTVTNFSQCDFQVDVMPETMKSTSLNDLDTGSHVNLERSLAVNGRVGGHFVSGHVDGIGKVMEKQRKENASYYKVVIPEEFQRFVFVKGSIAVDGVSLTIFSVSDKEITLSLIPHTVAETVLGGKEPGDSVNLEFDMLAKYVQNMMEQQIFHKERG
ncbi:riboflavin synthase [Lentibacillus sp. N15]|uniref:riboflavin synthase n=1 Tax=Lentibacillus songyuanensis TaxID=3136161 RepID=UPI0031B9ED4A